MLESARTLLPKDSEVQQELASSYKKTGRARLQEGKLDVALSSFRKAMDVEPDSTDAYRGGVLALLRGEQFEEAHSLLKGAVTRFPNNERLLLQTGYLFELKGQWTEAVNLYRKAVAANTESALSIVYLGRAQREAGNLEESTATLHVAVTRFPESALAAYELAMTLRKVWTADPQIKRLLQSAVQLDPQRPEPVHMLGKIELDEGKLKQAENYLNTEVTLDANAAEPHYLLATVYRREGDAARSRNEFARYQQLKDKPLRTALALELGV